MFSIIIILTYVRAHTSATQVGILTRCAKLSQRLLSHRASGFSVVVSYWKQTVHRSLSSTAGAFFDAVTLLRGTHSSRSSGKPQT